MSRLFEKQEKVRFRHVDYAGIVFYPRFLEMLNDLVEDWFEEALERPFAHIHQSNGIPTVDLKVQFRKAARIGEVLTKFLWVTKLGTASVQCGFRFTDGEGTTCLEGEVTLVNVRIAGDRGSIKTDAFSPEMRDRILPFVI